ncbi:hypothetical protein TW85_13465 [Marinomonas sp. S3726]|jgi:hypothetical protein|uniref:DUF6279 family lipoprotein n=1 Tax=Marinomonas sp. S3726 TaxID=579484 RepID=UPI0005FA70BB|nr:DUF6279 family lipoprotein [Marinomonas sp. S3726]KJZ13234.1 hypothetical protein TW85_13465 [Marinomonas sp. S3726]
MKTLLIIFLSISLTACSLGSTAYKHLDYVVLWYASDYVSLDKSQKLHLSEVTKHFVAWHRSNEIEKYKVVLAEFKQDIAQQTMTDERANYYRQQIRLFLSKVRFYLSPHLIPLLNSLSDSQYTQIVEALDKEVNSDKKPLTSDEKIKKMQDELEEWYGTLKPAQLDILANINAKREVQAPIWRAANQAWLDTFKEASKQAQTPRSQAIKALLLETLTPSDSGDYSEREEWMQVWRLADEAQRQSILDKLSEYQELLDDVSN